LNQGEIGKEDILERKKTKVEKTNKGKEKISPEEERNIVEIN
jgi:hypothetical protein